MPSKKIAYQGIPGAFSDIAIKHYWNNQAAGVPARTFPELFKLVKNKKADFGMVPIENSLAGSVYQNYDLLSQSRVKIVGELYLRIKHNLLVVSQKKNASTKQRLKSLTKVYSHPVALAQCQAFFAKYPWLQPTTHEDTAGSAQELSQKGNKQEAAIASSLAGKLYGLQTLKRGIETNKQNYTRFVVIAAQASLVAAADKISLTFTLPHRPGTLYQVLKILAEKGLNLTKIESRPIIGKPWEYRFYLDIEQSQMTNYWPEVKPDLQKTCQGLKILGMYQKGTTIG